MAQAVRIADEIVKKARIRSKVENRSVGGQIEYWAKIGKVAEENPEISYNMIKDILLAREEAAAGETEEFTFDGE